MLPYEENPSMFRNNPAGFVICISLMIIPAVGLLIVPEAWRAFIPIFLTGLGWFLYWWWTVLSQKLTVTTERVILRTGILSKHINEVYHADISNIRIDQTLLQRIFDAGDVHFASAATGGIEINIKGIPHPEEVKEIIENYHRQYLHPRRDFITGF